MKNNYLPILLLILISTLSQAQAPSYNWAKNISGTKHESLLAITSDLFGNTYAAGNFASNTLNFDGTTLANTTTDGVSIDIFIEKVDNNGAVISTIKIGGSGNQGVHAIKTDALGNLYVFGTSSNNFSIGSTTIVNTIGAADFLVKLDSNGAVVWAKTFGSNSLNLAICMDISQQGNIIIAGSFVGASIVLGSTTLSNSFATYADIFLAQLDTDGNFTWAKKIGGNTADLASSVKTDTTGNVYITGSFNSDSITLETATLNNANPGVSPDMFLAKYDNGGNLVWANRYGNTGDDRATSIALNAAGDLILLGYFDSSTVNFGGIVVSSGAFLAKISSAGSVLWAKKTGNTINMLTSNCLLDAQDNIYVAGNFSGTGNFDGIPVSSATFNYSPCMVKYNLSGTAQWVKKTDYINGVSSDGAAFVNMNTTGDLFFGGIYNSPSIILDAFTLTNASTYVDSFLTGINHSSLATQNFIKNNISIYPNPATDILHLDNLETLGTSNYKISAITGQIVRQSSLNGQDKIDVGSLHNGMYVLSIGGQNFKFVKK